MQETTAASAEITRKSASNLALAFILLPKPKRDAMCVLYAFCREIDDVADDETRSVSDRAQALQHWRADLQTVYSGGSPTFAVNKELVPVIKQYKLPFQLFDELIQGVEMDLDIKHYETWQELERYCYHVASVVGLLSIEIFGYKNPACKEYAIHLGKALQLTNILRDVANDAERGRVYLPREELRAHGVTQDEILAGKYSERYVQLATSVAARAREHYQAATRLLPAEDRKAMASAELMGSVYWGLLRKLESKRFNVFDDQKTRLTKPQKLFLIGRTWLRMWRGAMVPNYGCN
ncbi:MAG TPA: presqualene diphosphate synthase HpnD [Methylomirabilota bacterium]|nr:presqualene diphosphate synthase HpnD [Methylomirabilota bacterium]